MLYKPGLYINIDIFCLTFLDKYRYKYTNKIVFGSS